MQKNLLSVMVSLVLGASIYSQNLSRTERKIVKTVEANTKASIELLRKVVNVNSGTLNLKGVKRVGDIFEQEFRRIDFRTSWVSMPETMNRAGHLFAETTGSKGKRLLLIGHLDTVFEENSPFQSFEMINDSIAHAPGANDMKGGDVIVLYALKALHEHHLLDNAQIIVAFTGDEESTGSPLELSRRDLIAAAKRSDVALGFEASTGFNYATIARRGSSGWMVEVEGKRAHSSRIFSESVGAGAIFEMGRILHGFYTDVKGEELLTFNAGTVLGGTTLDYDDTSGEGKVFGKTNVVAQHAEARGGLRFISEEQKERARSKMREIVDDNLPGTTAKIMFKDSYPAMEPTIGNTRLLESLNQVSLALGQGEVKAYDPGKRGAADTSFVARYVDCLDGLGAMGSDAHTLRETINLNTMEALTKRMAVFIYRLINQ